MDLGLMGTTPGDQGKGEKEGGAPSSAPKTGHDNTQVGNSFNSTGAGS